MYSLYRTDSGGAVAVYGGGLLLATCAAASATAASDTARATWGLYCLFVESGEWYLGTVT